jgi:hypothetical protein
MKRIRAVSFDDFVEWYLRRESTKPSRRARSAFGAPDAYGGDTARQVMAPVFILVMLVEGTTSELSHVLIPANDWTRHERLVRNGVARTLENAATHAHEPISPFGGEEESDYQPGTTKLPVNRGVELT